MPIGGKSVSLISSYLVGGRERERKGGGEGDVGTVRGEGSEGEGEELGMGGREAFPSLVWLCDGLRRSI